MGLDEVEKLWLPCLEVVTVGVAEKENDFVSPTVNDGVVVAGHSFQMAAENMEK